MKKKINKYKYLKKKKTLEEIIEKRYKILVIVVIIIMSLLLSMLFFTQVIRNDYYKEKLDKLTVTIIEGDSSPRGRIYDRNGVLIVDNISVKTIYYKKPNNIKDSEEVDIAYKVANFINVDYSKLTMDMLKNFWILNNKDKANERITDSEWKDYENRRFKKL